MLKPAWHNTANLVLGVERAAMAFQFQIGAGDGGVAAENCLVDAPLHLVDSAYQEIFVYTSFDQSSIIVPGEVMRK